jgi:hypothetical protein
LFASCEKSCRVSTHNEGFRATDILLPLMRPRISTNGRRCPQNRLGNPRFSHPYERSIISRVVECWNKPLNPLPTNILHIRKHGLPQSSPSMATGQLSGSRPDPTLPYREQFNATTAELSPGGPAFLRLHRPTLPSM